MANIRYDIDDVSDLVASRAAAREESDPYEYELDAATDEYRDAMLAAVNAAIPVDEGELVASLSLAGDGTVFVGGGVYSNGRPLDDADEADVEAWGADGGIYDRLLAAEVSAKATLADDGVLDDILDRHRSRTFFVNFDDTFSDMGPGDDRLVSDDYDETPAMRRLRAMFDTVVASGWTTIDSATQRLNAERYRDADDAVTMVPVWSDDCYQLGADGSDDDVAAAYSDLWVEVAERWDAQEDTNAAQYAQEDREALVAEGITPEDAEGWRVARFNPKTAKAWQDKGFAVEDATEWSDARFDAEEAERWRGAGLDPATAAALYNKGYRDPREAAGALEVARQRLTAKSMSDQL